MRGERSSKKPAWPRCPAAISTLAVEALAEEAAGPSEGAQFLGARLLSWWHLLVKSAHCFRAHARGAFAGVLLVSSSGRGGKSCSSALNDPGSLCAAGASAHPFLPGQALQGSRRKLRVAFSASAQPFPGVQLASPAIELRQAS